LSGSYPQFLLPKRLCGLLRPAHPIKHYESFPNFKIAKEVDSNATLLE
jgi:hypothetical protein